MADGTIQIDSTADFQSDWRPDDGKTAHTTPITHDLGIYPSSMTIWFSPDKGEAHPIYSLPGNWGVPNNPVTVQLGYNSVLLQIAPIPGKAKFLHQVWEPSRWIQYEKGYWKVFLWK